MIQDVPNGIREHVVIDSLAIPQPRAIPDPLPDLCPRDFGGGGIFHQVVNWNTSIAAEPRLDVLQRNVNTPNKPLLRLATKRNFQQVIFADS